MLTPVVAILVAFAAVSEVQSQCTGSNPCPSNSCSQHPDSGYCQQRHTTYLQGSSLGSYTTVVYQQEKYTSTCSQSWGFTIPCTKYRTRSKLVTKYGVVYEALGLEGPCQPYCCEGYTGSGSSCTPICSPSCQNGGTCTSPGVCTCASGWTGPTCEQAICTPDCGEGGTCIAANTCAYPSTYGCQPKP